MLNTAEDKKPLTAKDILEEDYIKQFLRQQKEGEGSKALGEKDK